MNRITLRSALVVLLSVGAQWSASAQSAAPVPTRRAATLDSLEREAMGAQQRAMVALRRSSPAEYDEIRTISSLVRHWQLGRLGYLSGPFDAAVTAELVAAIRSYEQDRGLSLTGDPLSFELEKSLEDDEEFLAPRPSLPSRTVRVTADYVHARGAWVFADMGDQLIAVTVDCDKRLGRCVESQAFLYISSRHPFSSLSTDQQVWAVAQWDDVEIATEPLDFSCMRHTLRINLVRETATKVWSRNSNAAACSNADGLERVMTLSDGGEIASQRAGARSKVPFPLRLTPRASAIINRHVPPASP